VEEEEEATTATWQESVHTPTSGYKYTTEENQNLSFSSVITKAYYICQLVFCSNENIGICAICRRLHGHELLLFSFPFLAGYISSAMFLSRFTGIVYMYVSHRERVGFKPTVYYYPWPAVGY